MHIIFLGTRGNIEPKSKRHLMHTSLLIEYRRSKIMIDCGKLWLHKFRKIHPSHIVLTHAHPDHAFGLQRGSPCPVWATKKTWDLIDAYPISQKKVILPRKETKIGPFIFEAYPVIHSLRAPAVGYRISNGRHSFFYAPDVAWIKNRKGAFRNISFYIGDGATVQRNMIRKDKQTNKIFGHANIRQQLTWCKKEKVPKMIITHCGSDIVANERKAKKTIDQLAQERAVDAIIAFDQMKMSLFPRKNSRALL